MEQSTSDPTVGAQLAVYFWRSGHVRRQRRDRIEAEDWSRYKKGEEVRINADSEAEVEHICALLIAAGFKPGKPYAHGKSKFRVPIYDKRQVSRFLELVGEDPDDGHVEPDDR